jgi:hypothetical protein
MTQPDPKYVASSRPVNRRTAGRQPLPPQPVNPVVQERLAAAKARSRLGPPLAEQVRLAGAAAARVPLHPLAAVGGIVATASTVGLFVAWLQASALFAAAGGAGLLAGLALGWRSRRPPPAVAFPPSAPLFDDACLQALDRALELLAPEVPDAIAAQLTGLKQLIVRIARQGSAAVDENFTMDDRLYMNECVRRYLPDTLQSYLAVPREQRSVPMLEGQSAVQLLESQLGLLHTELEKREARMARSAAEQMLKQQRFLKSKAGR